MKGFRPLIFAVVALSFFLTFASSAFGKAPEEAELVAMHYLGEQMASWIDGIKPESLSIFAINLSGPLDPEHSRYFETELRKGLSDRGINKVQTCMECRNPYVTVKDDKVIVSAGVADAETLKRVAGKQPVQAFLIIDLYRTKLRMEAQGQLLDAQSGDMLGVERFSVPALNLSDSSAQILLTFGAGMVLPNSGPQDFTPCGNASLLEEVGFAKAGLTTGAVISSTLGTLIYVVPTISFRGHFGNSGMSYALMPGLGYGFVGGFKGLDTRISFEIFWGSWAVFGVEGNYVVSSGSTKPAIPSYAGFHVGIAFGR